MQRSPACAALQARPGPVPCCPQSPADAHLAAAQLDCPAIHIPALSDQQVNSTPAATCKPGRAPNTRRSAERCTWSACCRMLPWSSSRCLRCCQGVRCVWPGATMLTGNRLQQMQRAVPRALASLLCAHAGLHVQQGQLLCFPNGLSDVTSLPPRLRRSMRRWSAPGSWARRQSSAPGSA